MENGWPLVGRGPELARIETSIRTGAAAGVVIAGRPGLGKTRLASEAVQRATSRGRASAWAVATQAAASIPFGPLAHLLPDELVDVSSRLDLLRQASRHLAARAPKRPLVLGVDDAHLLDDASAALVHHLATTNTAFVVATVRAGNPAPDAVVQLWKDGFAEWLELQPLDTGDLTTLIETVVQGQVDSAALHELLSLSQGNALFLRELLRSALESGALAEVDGVWRANGPLTSGTRLAEVIGARLGRLGPDVREVAEIVAIAEPIDEVLLATVAPAANVEATDRAGLLEMLPDPRRTALRLVHPLYSELLRSTTTQLRARTLRRRLAKTLESTGLRRRDDVLRLGLWQLEGGVSADPSLLLRAARQASAGFFDHELARRLAGAAVEAGGGPPALLALAEALHNLGRPDQAETILRDLEARARDTDRPRITLVRANNLLRGLGRPREAEDVIKRGEAVTTSRDWLDEFAVLRATMALAYGSPLDALSANAEVLANPAARQRVVLRALTGSVAASAYRGRTTEADAAADRAIALLGGPAADVSLIAERMLALRSLAHRLAGRLDEEEEFGTRRYRQTLERGADDLRAAWALALGEVALTRGQVTTAVRRLREGLALMHDHGRVFGIHGLSWCLGSLAQAAAVAGEPQIAAAALREVERVTPERFFVPSQGLGRAWVLATTGKLARAQAIALEVARRARERQSDAFEAVALHDAARMGAAEVVAERLAELAEGVEGPLAQLSAEHAGALAGGDAPQLDHVSQGFAEVGALLLAAECAAEAAELYARAGRKASASASSGRATTLAEACEGARTPALELAGGRQTLTPREREIAIAAAQGSSSKQIAHDLVLSVRTIENHLHNAYAKLGVTGRQGLRDVLMGDQPHGRLGS